jgi:Class II Aldolase and Adducin N-terminal domain
MYRKDSDELAAARAELVSYATRLLDDGLAVGSAGNGSAALAAAAAEALDGRSAVILRNHEAVTYGRDLAQAYEPATLSPGELDEVAAETRPRRSGQTGNVPPCTSRARRRYSSSPTSTSTGSAAAGHCVAARHRGRRRGHHRLRRRLHRGHAGLPAARRRAGRRGSLVPTGLGSDAGIEGLGQVLDFLGRAQPAVAGRIAAAAAGPLIHEGADG